MQPPPPLVPNWSRFRTIRQVLDKLCVVYGFEAALLVGEEGLPLAAATSTCDSEALAAIAADLMMAAQKTQVNLGWRRLDEVSVMAREGMRLVGRSLALPDQDLSLVIMLPYWMSYHRAMAQASEVIRWAWTERGMKHRTSMQD